MDKLKIKYVKHDKIRFRKWDETIMNSFNYNVYSLSSYLNIITEGNWDALIMGNYDYIMPIPTKKKFFLKLSLQPKFAQQLGVFSKHKITTDIVLDFIHSIPQNFKYVELKLNKFNKIDFIDNGEVKINKNYELDLIYNYAKLYEKFSTNTKRNIKKANKNKVLVVEIDYLTFFRFFKNHFSKQFKSSLSKKDYKILYNLLQFGIYKQNFINYFYAAIDENRTILAAAFFIKFKQKLYYIDGISSTNGKNFSAMFAIFDYVIKLFSEKNLILDFEGSNIDSVARFYKGFGAIETFYPTIIINKLGFLSKLKRK